jgi:hypothetical protein
MTDISPEEKTGMIASMNAALEKGIEPPLWKTETHRSPVEMVFPDGRRVFMEYDVSSYDDWRDTSIGRINFGKIKISPYRHVVEYPDGRQQPTTPEVQTAIEIARYGEAQSTGGPREFLRSIGRLFGLG